MPVQVRNPTSDEAASGTWTGTAGQRWTVVDDFPDTTGADQLTHGTTAGHLTFGFPAFTLPPAATGISVFVKYYDFKNGSQACNVCARLKVGTTYHNAPTHNPGNGSNNRTLRTDAFATNPKTGAAWTPEQLNRTDATNPLNAFGWASTDASPTITLSSIQIEATYEAVYALDAGVGGYSTTGRDASLLHLRSLIAETGGYNLQGASAFGEVTSSLQHYALDASEGIYGQTGQASALSASRSLQAGAGNTALEGAAASLSAARTAAGLSGGYNLTGAGANLKRFATILAQPGAYSLTGTELAVAKASLLTALPASYAVTGALAGLSALRTLPAQNGGYAYEGASAFGAVASPAVGYTLDAGAGDYASTGLEASTRRAYALTALPAVYTLTGHTATFPGQTAPTPGLMLEVPGEVRDFLVPVDRRSFDV